MDETLDRLNYRLGFNVLDEDPDLKWIESSYRIKPSFGALGLSMLVITLLFISRA